MRITKYLLFPALTLLSLPALAQHTFNWATQIGGPYLDLARSHTLDTDGNIITTGEFSGTVDFDPGPAVLNLSGAGFKDIFISKLSSKGQFLWALALGGTGNEVCYNVITDNQNNIYITGYFEHQLDFDPGPASTILTSSGDSDIFLAKYDPNGNLMWAHKFGGNGLDNGLSLSIDTSGNIFLSGIFSWTVDFDPGPAHSPLTSAGNYDAFILKLSTQGSFLWAKRIGGTQNVKIPSIVNDIQGNVYATGEFRGTVDFDPGLGTYNLGTGLDFKCFLLKLDKNGGFKFARLWQNFQGISGKAIAIDVNQNIYLTGDFGGTIDFDPDTNIFNLTSILTDAFVVKMDSASNFAWAVGFGGSEWDAGNSLTVDSAGNVYCAGAFRQTVDFDPGVGTHNVTSAGYDDAFISMLNDQGDFQWVKTIGSSQDDKAFSITTDLAGSHIYTSGFFDKSVDFDPGPDSTILTTLGNYDSFIQLLTNCQLLNIDYGVVNDSNTLLANQVNAGYQWVRCDSSFNTIPGETGSSFTPSINGSYAVVVSMGACADTSICVVIDDITIEEIQLKNGIDIFPNPNSGTFNLKLRENAEVVIYNAIGKKVFQGTFSGGLQMVSLPDHCNGLYIVDISQDNQHITKRVVVNGKTE